MEKTKEELKKETEKWLKRIQERRKSLRLRDERRADFLKNIDAYIADSQHFIAKGDLIRSFEAVIWSWAMLELGIELSILTQDTIESNDLPRIL